MPDYEHTKYPWYYQRNKIKKVVIENGVTRIGSLAFCDYSGLTSVSIPNSVTSIGRAAFYGTKWYNNQPDGLFYTGKVLYAYKGTMPSDTKIEIKEGTTEVVSAAFYDCSGLISVSIPNSVTSIGDYAFQNCSSLTTIAIPNSVMSIGKSAFSGCSGLSSITIGNSVTSIGSAAFLNCSSLTSITIPNSVENIESEAFSGCSALASVTIPNSVTSIGKSAFKGSKWYDNQPNGVVYAGKVLYAYKGSMPSNTKIVIKEGTVGITSSAFQGYTELSSITIPNSVTTIGGSAFYNCSGLTSITIPNSIKSIGDRVFYNCSALTSITIPESVASIGQQAFSGCYSLISTTIPNSVTNIRYQTFYNCYNLTSITIPNSVTSIESSAFSGCSALTSITISESVTSIGEGAFSGCSALTSITIPESVTSIGGGAFNGAKLRNIVIKAKTPPSGESAFSNQTYYHTALMVPEGCWDAYAYDDNWYQFINIREMAYNEANLTNSKAYMMKSATEGAYLFYDSVNDCVGELNETTLDDTEENNTWMTVEVDGKHYVYNLGAKKFLVSDKANGYSLSDTPVSIDIEDGKDAIVFGKSKEFYMVINDKLNVVEGLESQITSTTGIKSPSADANQTTVTYNVNGQIVPDNAKGLYIKNGKKVVVK